MKSGLRTPFLVFLLLLLGALSAPRLWAQEPEEMEPPDPLMDALKEREVMETLPQATATTTEKTDEDRKQIEKNYRKASAAYDRILEHDDTSTGTLSKRIENLEALIGDTRPKLDGRRAAYRTLDLDFTNRMLYMKQQRDQGKLDQATFDKLAKEESAARDLRRTQLQSDIAFYQSELKQYDKLLNDLRSELRLVEAKASARQKTAARGSGRAKTPARPHSEVLLEGINARLDRLSGFSTRRIGEPLASPQDFAALER